MSVLTVKPSAYLLIRRGRVLTPWSRLRYRWLRLRTGHALFLQDPEGWMAVVGSVVRVPTLPLLLLVDYLWWPLARLTVARSGWTVVRVEFRDVDAEFVRVAEATSKDEVEEVRETLARDEPSHTAGSRDR